MYSQNLSRRETPSEHPCIAPKSSPYNSARLECLAYLHLRLRHPVFLQQDPRAAILPHRLRPLLEIEPDPNAAELDAEVVFALVSIAAVYGPPVELGGVAVVDGNAELVLFVPDPRSFITHLPADFQKVGYCQGILDNDRIALD